MRMSKDIVLEAARTRIEDYPDLDGTHPVKTRSIGRIGDLLVTSDGRFIPASKIVCFREIPDKEYSSVKVFLSGGKEILVFVAVNVFIDARRNALDWKVNRSIPYTWEYS